MGETILEAVERIKAIGESSKRAARDPVNQPMINNWTEALGDTHPAYLGDQAVAPPAMAQVWTMNGLHGSRAKDDPLGLIMEVLDSHGFTSVVATNCEQTYHRYLRVGEYVSVTTTLEDVSGPKVTGLGEGWFVTTRNRWYVDTEVVAEMLFRVLKFFPPQNKTQVQAKVQSGSIADPLLPTVNQDTKFFWEGTALGELRIQKWPISGTLRHPPGPMDPTGAPGEPEYIVASGFGSVYSYVVHHHPQVPGRQTPFIVALIELAEGVRMLGELRGISPEEIKINLPVQVEFVQVSDEITLAAWQPRSS
ncbi:MAG: bifunctional MaoC family dehydratase N-terminal/OB-fold nucleic acid binding domain-containing protein [Mycobacteriaceae bacterium]